MKLQMPFRKFECWKGIKQSVLEKFAKSYEIGQFLGQTAHRRIESLYGIRVYSSQNLIVRLERIYMVRLVCGKGP